MLKSISETIQRIWPEIHWPAVPFLLVFVGVLISVNYSVGLESKYLSKLHPWPLKWVGFTLLYGCSVIGAVAILIQTKASLQWSTDLLLVIALGAAIFALKVALPLVNFSTHQWINRVADWPFRALVCGMAIYLFWQWWQPDIGQHRFYLKTQSVPWHLYFLLLLMMFPLLWFSAQLPAFQQAYPKVAKLGNWPLTPTHIAGFELSYGIDFFTIEWFFRGAMIAWLLPYLGTNALFPVAVFYCVIHFGKPLPECISSFGGALILGTCSLVTQSIWGGLMVHLGIAWLMEWLTFK